VDVPALLAFEVAEMSGGAQVKEAGTVLILPSTPSGRMSARMSATRVVYSTRSSLRQSGA